MLQYSKFNETQPPVPGKRAGCTTLTANNPPPELEQIWGSAELPERVEKKHGTDRQPNGTVSVRSKS